MAEISDDVWAAARNYRVQTACANCYAFTKFSDDYIDRYPEDAERGDGRCGSDRPVREYGVCDNWCEDAEAHDRLWRRRREGG